MKLVHRVSVFFLAALAIVLVIYSSIFYAFVRARLVQQFEQEVQGALNSLVAAVEIEPEEVKWQPLEHAIVLGAVQGPDEVQWVVIGDGRRVVEKSRNATSELIAQANAIASSASTTADTGQTVTPDDWHILHQRLVAPIPDRRGRELDEFDEIVVMVAHSAAPLNANLNRLLLLVCALPVGTWLVAVAAGHWFCRRALQPVLDMSQQARSMTGANFHSRLPVSETGDELADLAVAFNTLLDHQHRAFEQQRRFTGDAAHELRTPLTVLLGQIDVALRRTRSPQEYAATLGLLRDQTAQLQTIVESLLFLARAEEDAILPDSETFSLAAWLPEYMNRWNEHPRRGDISLRIASVGTTQIKASSALLTRLMDNLIENALKYSTPGSRVEVIAGRDDAEALVEVQDQGRGIGVEDLSEIFNPFFRSRAARDAGIAGTGLGLAIAARIATACGGWLECTSELGRGSRFTLRLPTASNNVLAGNAC
ncbi:MAG: ATP-binding protein [Pirellulaceae bacterium]